MKRTNARSSSAALVSLKLTDGEKLAPNASSKRLIEFIGDSITVGYATVAGKNTTWSTATEDATKTYASQIAEAFGAEYMVTAISGRGVVRNTGGDTDKLLPAIYGYVDQYNNPGVKYDFARQPDVIVINLGTNDASGNNSSLTTAEFSAGLKAFLLDVRAKNPNAEIVYTYGMMTTKYMKQMQDVVKELQDAGDTKISFVKLDACKANERAINHPTAEAYISRGEVLIEHIAQLTGWVVGEEPVTEPVTEPATEPVTEPVTEEPLPESDTNAPATTLAPETTAPEQPSGGCGASALATAATVTLTAAAAVVLTKKKEDDKS